jgi:anti-sigma regulatory factor (Ser/Thr protein kinase)
VLLERLAQAAGSMADDPRILEIALPPDPRSAADARHAVAAYCRARGVREDLLQVGVLVISELVTNVVLHAATPMIVWAEYEDSTLTLAATDGDTALPALLAPDDTHEGGRGVAIIDQLSASWGLTRTGLGKVIWVTLR